MIAFAPGAVDAMMLLALALHLDPVYVGAHHLARIFFVSLTMPLIARAASRRKPRPPRDDAKPPRAAAGAMAASRELYSAASACLRRGRSSRSHTSTSASASRSISASS